MLIDIFRVVRGGGVGHAATTTGAVAGGLPPAVASAEKQKLPPMPDAQKTPYLALLKNVVVGHVYVDGCVGENKATRTQGWSSCDSRNAFDVACDPGTGGNPIFMEMLRKYDAGLHKSVSKKNTDNTLVTAPTPTRVESYSCVSAVDKQGQL